MKKCNICGEDRFEEFYESRRTRCKECTKKAQYKFNDENPDYLKNKNHRRRAMKLALPFVKGANLWSSVKKRFDGRCAISNSTDIVLEHVIPMSWGHLGTTVHNVVPMDATLNLEKGAKNFLDWVLSDEMASRIDEDKINDMIYYLAEKNGLSDDEYMNFIYWCEDNKRTVDEVIADPRPSIVIWKAALELNVGK